MGKSLDIIYFLNAICSVTGCNEEMHKEEREGHGNNNNEIVNDSATIATSQQMQKREKDSDNKQ